MTWALEMIGNTSPFDITGHPAITIPAEVTDRRPIGMMIVGKHWDEKCVLTFARAYESLVGGFPVQPAAVELGTSCNRHVGSPLDLRTKHFGPIRVTTDLYVPHSDMRQQVSHSSIIGEIP